MKAHYVIARRWHITRLLRVCHRNWTRYYCPGLAPLRRRSPVR
jgi:hypothetical protein